jgi:hypothetical protein
MPPQVWQFTDGEFNDAINSWTDKEAGALVSWARQVVDSLHYLADLDDTVFADPARPTLGHGEQAVNVAHVRWACMASITALDLCAATIWRLNASVKGYSKEKSLRDFDPAGGEAVEDRRCRVRPEHLVWLDRVLADDRYRTVIAVRNPLAHGRTIQTHYGSMTTDQLAPHEGRSDFALRREDPTWVNARALVETAMEVATDHVERFIADLVLRRDDDPSGTTKTHRVR